MLGDETHVRKVTYTHFSKTQDFGTSAAGAQSTLTVVDSKHYSGNVHTKPWLGSDIINIDSSVHNYNNHFSKRGGRGGAWHHDNVSFHCNSLYTIIPFASASDIIKEGCLKTLHFDT